MAVRRTVFGRADPGVDQVALPQHICYRAELGFGTCNCPSCVRDVKVRESSLAPQVVISPGRCVNSPVAGGHCPAERTRPGT